MFDPEYFPYLWWRWKAFADADARAQFYAELERKRAAGIKQIVLDPPDGTVYAGAGYFVDTLPDWMAGGTLHPWFVEMCEEVLAIMGTAIFYCYGGGQKDAVHIYDGQLRRVAEQIRDHGWTERLIVLWAWESYGITHECTAKQNSDAWTLLYDVLGPGCMLAGHVDGQSQRFTWSPSPWEDDAPIPRVDTAEIEAWYAGGGGKVKLHFHQIPGGRGGPSTPWEPRLLEGADRLLPPGTPMPLVGTGEAFRDPDLRDSPRYLDREPFGPNWNGRARPVGPLVLCLWEPGIPIGYIRNQVPDTVVAFVAERATGLGITSQGCLPVA